MIHFFLTFSDDVSDTPFVHALKDQNIEHKIFSGSVLLRYRHRFWLLLVGLPKLILFGLVSAWQSLVISQPVPDAVVLGSHLEALVFAIIRWIFGRKTRIYLLGFIFTRRRNPFVEQLRRLYFNHLFKLVNGILCYSIHEVNRYNNIFQSAQGKFAFVPYGLHIDGYEQTTEFRDPAKSYALSAGRSGRDYPTLFKVFSESGYPLHVICDTESALKKCIPFSNITVLRQCYDDSYLLELRQAGMVIIPLAVDDISAGQMVLIQAMAYQKPIIATRTSTIEEYLTHDLNALLVPPNNSEILREAVDCLRKDTQFAARLANNAYTAFKNKHCMKVLVDNIVRTILSMETAYWSKNH